MVNTRPQKERKIPLVIINPFISLGKPIPAENIFPSLEEQMLPHIFTKPFNSGVFPLHDMNSTIASLREHMPFRLLFHLLALLLISLLYVYSKTDKYNFMTSLTVIFSKTDKLNLHRIFMS